MTQKLVEYCGDKVEGRKYPTLSSPENVVETQAIDQKLFIFGGVNTMCQVMNDKGYHMYNLRENTMQKLSITSKDQ